MSGLKELKQTSIKKEKEYLRKQKEIATYLEYRKTFIGKVKYFFKPKKKETKEDVKTGEESVDSGEKVNIDILEILEKEKDLYNLYTIENLLTVYNLYKKQEYNIKNIELDTNSLKLKIENMELKIKNASIYIDEINEHKKSIFEFWKFANKDERLTLEEGKDELIKADKVKAVFDYDMDIEDLGIKMDKIQRTKLSTEELNSVFLASTNILHTMNLFRQDEYVSIDMQKLMEELEKVQQDGNMESYDIFGVIVNDRTRVRRLGNKTHREAEREKFRVLNFNKNTDIFEFKNNISKTVDMLSESFNKITTPVDLNIYILSNSELDVSEYYTCEINEENILDKANEGTYNLYKLRIEEGMPLIFLTNSVYYDNKHNTLPLGMDVDTRVLIDCSKFEFELTNNGAFKANRNIDKEENFKIYDIKFYEYIIKLKTNAQQEGKKI